MKTEVQEVGAAAAVAGFSRVEFLAPSQKKDNNLIFNQDSPKSHQHQQDLSDASKMTQINLISGVMMQDDLHSMSQINNVNRQQNLSASKSSHVRPTGTESGSPRPYKVITTEKSQLNSNHMDFSKHASEEHHHFMEAQTPKNVRNRNSFVMQDGKNSNAATQSKNQKKQSVNRQLTMKQPSGADGYQVSLTDVMSIGTKHRASFTQTQLSNDPHMNSQANAAAIIAQQPTMVNDKIVNNPMLQTALKSSQISNNPMNTTGQGSMRQSSSFQNTPANHQMIKLSNVNNEHIISIFDKDTEKSYLLERQVTMPTGVAGEQEKNGPSIFKVQEVGTARFKCLPVTDYGKIMNIHRQKQQRKIQTADGQSRRNRNQQNSHRRGRSMGIKTGITSQETFHTHGKYKGKFQSQNTANLHHQHAYHTANAEKETAQKHTNVWMQQQASLEKNGSMIGNANQLRNSKSSAISGQRKEVFSKTKFINDQGIQVTQRTAFKAHLPLSTTSSKAFGEPVTCGILSGYLEDQGKLKGINSLNNISSQRTQHRTATARTNVVRPIYIDKLTNNQTATGYCCCPETTVEDNSAVTIGTAGQIATPITASNNLLHHQHHIHSNHTGGCQQYETLTSSHRGTIHGHHQQTAYALKPQEKKFMKKRAQSQGGVRVHSYPRSSDNSTLNTVTGSRNFQSNTRGTTAATGGLNMNRQQVRNTASGKGNNHQQQQSPQLHNGVGAKLMSIASDLRKNILPKQHEQINEIYKQRISNYLSLLAIHGEANRSIVNNIFNASCASTGGNIDEEHLNELLDQIKKQQATTSQQMQVHQLGQSARNHMHMPVDHQQVGSSGQVGSMVDENGSGIFRELEMVDNVRPLRNNIIESVRGMPSYYEGRIKKDPIKLKQFEMTMMNGNSNGGQQTTLTSQQEAVNNKDHLNEQQLMELAQLGELVSQPDHYPTSAMEGGRSGLQSTTTKTLQAVLNETRQKLLLLNNNRNNLNNLQSAGGGGADEKRDNSNLISRNKLNMMAISANEVDRMLYKNGLASPTVQKTCHNEMMRRAWANRRVSQKVTKFSNVQALIREHPPVSPLIKTTINSPQGRDEQDEQDALDVDFHHHLDSAEANYNKTLEIVAKKNLDQMRQVRTGAENYNGGTSGFQNSNGQGGAIRKSLMLSQVSNQDTMQDDSDKEDDLHVNSRQNNYDSNMSPMDESESFIQLVPKQNQMADGNSDQQQQQQIFKLQKGLTFDGVRGEMAYFQGEMPDPYQSFGMARSPAAYNDTKDGGQDLTHILNNKNAAAVSSRNGQPQFAQNGGQLNLQNVTDLMIKGTAPGSSHQAANNGGLGLPPHQQSPFANSNNTTSSPANANIESQKMVKTYEFHLPMHHIREEEQRSQAELYNSSSKYKPGIGLQQASTNNISRYNLSKQSTVNRISKKRTLGLMPGGKRDDISSQMLENETLADQQNSLRNLNLVGSSMYGDQAATNMRINISQSALRKGKSQTQNRSSMDPAAQSFEANEEASSLKKRVAAGVVSQSIDMANQATYQQQIASGEERMDSNHKAGKMRNNMYKKQAFSNMTNRNGPSPTETNSSRRRGATNKIKRTSTNNNASIAAARNSPLICLSQQELNERKQNQIVMGIGGGTENINQSGGQQSDPANVAFQQYSSTHSKPGKIQLHSMIHQAKNQSSSQVGSGQNNKQSNRGSRVSGSPRSAARAQAAIRMSKESHQSVGSHQQPPQPLQKQRTGGTHSTTINHSEHTHTHHQQKMRQQQQQQQIMDQQQKSSQQEEEDVLRGEAHEGEMMIQEEQTMLISTPVKEQLLHGGVSETEAGGSSSQKPSMATRWLGTEDRQTRTAMMAEAENEDENQTPDDAMNTNMIQNSGRYSPQPPEAYLIVHSSDGQSEVLEIAQRNFELFGGKQLDSGAKLTGSSIATSDAARCTLAAVNSKDEDGFINSTGEFRLDVGEHQIEVINISQAVQTSSNPNVLSSSRENSPNISNLYVTRNNHTPTNITLMTNNGAQQQNQNSQAAVSKPKVTSGPESRLRYIERLLSETDSGQPRQTQVKMQQFEAKMIPKRQTKSASGYPAVNRIQKQFRNPSFKHAQLYMPVGLKGANKDELKSNMISELNGKARFKTFKANNELYMRIDPVKNEDGTVAINAATDPNNELKAYNALLANMQRNSIPGAGGDQKTSNQTSMISARGSYDKNKLDFGNTTRVSATRGSQFNTLEFQHKPECPLHELEAFEAQEGIWVDHQSNNLMIQDNNSQQQVQVVGGGGSKAVDQGNKVVYRKQSQNNSGTWSRQGGIKNASDQNNDNDQDTKAQASSGEDLSGISKYQSNVSPDEVGQHTIIQSIQEPAYQSKDYEAQQLGSTQKISLQDKSGNNTVKSKVSNTTLVSLPVTYLADTANQRESHAAEFAQMNDTITKGQSQSPFRRGCKYQGGDPLIGSRPTSIITQPVLRQVNKTSGKTKKNSLDVEVKTAGPKATLQVNSVPASPMTQMSQQQQPASANNSFNLPHQQQQVLQAQHQNQTQQRMVQRAVKGGVKVVGQPGGSTSKKQHSSIQGHEFEVLGTNPNNIMKSQNHTQMMGSKRFSQQNSNSNNNNKTINVPYGGGNKRHIDVSEFGNHKRDKFSKSPGLLGANEQSVVNHDLNFSLGIETQVEGGNNYQDYSQTFQSHVQSRTSTPMTPTNDPTQQNTTTTLSQMQQQKQQQQILQVQGSGKVKIGDDIRQENAGNPLQLNGQLSSNHRGSKVTVDDDDDQDAEFRPNPPMKPKRTWKSKTKKNFSNSSKQDKQLRLTNMVLQCYADKKNTNRRPLYSNTQYAGGPSVGSAIVGGGMANGPIQKRGSNQDIPFELSSFNSRQNHRSKTQSNAAGKGNNYHKNNVMPGNNNAPYQKTGLAKIDAVPESAQSSQYEGANDSFQAVSPEALKHILNSRAAPVVVPRRNDGMYQGTNRQGLDRAINYINYNQSQRGQLNIHEQTSAAGSSYHPMMNEMNQESADQLFYHQDGSNYQPNGPADGGVTAGFGSLESSYIGAIQPPSNVINTERSQQPGGSNQPPSFDQMGSLGSHQRENVSSGTVGIQQQLQLEIQLSSPLGYQPVTPQTQMLLQQREMQLDERGQTEFGSMICGMPCLEQTSLNQAHLLKYEESKIAIQISQQQATEAKNQFRQRLEENQQTTLGLTVTPQSYPSITYQEIMTTSQREIENLQHHHVKRNVELQSSAYKLKNGDAGDEYDDQLAVVDVNRKQDADNLSQQVVQSQMGVSQVYKQRVSGEINPKSSIVQPAIVHHHVKTHSTDEVSHIQHHHHHHHNLQIDKEENSKTDLRMQHHGGLPDPSFTKLVEGGEIVVTDHNLGEDSGRPSTSSKQ